MLSTQPRAVQSTRFNNHISDVLVQPRETVITHCSKSGSYETKLLPVCCFWSRSLSHFFISHFPSSFLLSLPYSKFLSLFLFRFVLFFKGLFLIIRFRYAPWTSQKPLWISLRNSDSRIPPPVLSPWGQPRQCHLADLSRITLWGQPCLPIMTAAYNERAGFCENRRNYANRPTLSLWTRRSLRSLQFRPRVCDKDTFIFALSLPLFF